MNAEAQEPRRRRRLRGPLVLAATFLLGALSGLGVAPLLRPPPGGLPPALDDDQRARCRRERANKLAPLPPR